MTDSSTLGGDASLRDYGMALPHGPNMDRRHVASQDIHAMNLNEKQIFDHLILPDDSYNTSGEYWADMNPLKRAKFTNSVDSKEAKKELKQIGRMMKADPLSPVGWYMRNAVIPGAGLLMEGYVLFSIGNLKPLLEKGFPDCWDDNTICNKTWVQAIDYLEICGIIVGQILVGIIGDW